MDAINAFNESLRANGHWIMAAGVAAPEHSVVIDNRQGAGVITQGSLFEQNEYVSGFWVIEASGHEQAQDLALAGSRACNRKVELRPFLG